MSDPAVRASLKPAHIALGIGGAVCVSALLTFLILPRRSVASAIAVPKRGLAYVSAGGAQVVWRSRPRFADSLDVSTFQKGNIHVHSSESDGDSPPEDVYGWYRDHGYAWVAMTDHNIFTDPARYRHLERKGSFVLVSGEEITMTGAGRQVHVNGLCTKRRIGGHTGGTATEALAWSVEQVKLQGGTSLVNHPNFQWALTFSDVSGAKGAALLEIHSGHPRVNQDGDETRPSHEALWDQALSSGMWFTGVAVDDAHTFSSRPPRKGYSPAHPGRGWVEVFANKVEADGICKALSAGRLYSSSGVKLTRIAVNATSLTVWTSAGARVEFIGDRGRVLSNQTTASDGRASYRLTGGERYVRARIAGQGGGRAWTAAYRVVELKP